MRGVDREPPAGEVAVRTVRIVNKRGLHGRAAARFVKLAGQFDAMVTVAKDDTEVSGLSIMGLMMLAAGPGCELEIKAWGSQAVQALDAIEALIGARFDES
ncbi:MAG: HPr family phosphocarrier protein [Pseudomonadota bacterium]